jgi:signal peptidase I
MKSEPWFYGCLSWMLPGAGQFLAGARMRGAAFLCVLMALETAREYTLCTSRFLGLVPWALLAVACLAAAILATWDAVRTGRRDWGGTVDARDPWFGVFLSLILGPLGYGYLRKWVLAVLWVILFVAGAFLLQTRLLHSMVLFFLFYAVPAHVYWISSKEHGRMRSRAAWPYLALLIFGMFCFGVGRYLNHRYEVWLGGPATGSMAPTMRVGEHYVVNGFAYVTGMPHVGDIVVIRTSIVPRRPEALLPAVTSLNALLTKRIVAEGGDVIDVNDGVIRVNGMIRVYCRRMPDGTENGTTSRRNLLAQHGPYVVPEGEFFVMGDNIDNSFDSRYFGPVPRVAIIGKVVKVVWPLSRARVLR